MNTNKEDMLGIWYPNKLNTRLRINERLLVREKMPYSQETEITENTPKAVIEKIGRWEVRDSIKIIDKEILTDKEGKHQIKMTLLIQKGEKIEYNIFLFTATEIKGLKTVFAVRNSGFETIEEAKNALKEIKFQNINRELFFSEEYLKTVVPTLKPMEEITKEDYIKVIKYVRSFENEIIAFAVQGESNTDYVIRTAAKKLAQEKLIFLGYSPEGFENSDYLKKFERDKDIEELNNVETEIKF
jgi:hypothetical protein